MHVDTVGYQTSSRPGDGVDQALVALTGRTRQVLPIGEGMKTYPDEPRAPGLRRRLHLEHGVGQVAAGLRHRPTHPGDDLDGALEEFLLDLGVLSTVVGCSHLLQHLWRDADESALLDIDKGHLDLDAETGPR